MASFLRRFLTDPGNSILLNIESINVLDLTPPASIAGIGTGAVCIVGEFENGPFATPTEVTSAEDWRNTFGVLGYTYGSLGAQNPCARKRSADAAVVPELWNGNGAVQLNGKKFARLIICRADTSVGSAYFTRFGSVSGSAKPFYNLATGQQVSFNVNAAGISTATFTGTPAAVAGAAGTFALVGGESVVLGYDGAANFTVGFLAGDGSVAAAIARINAAAGFAFATNSAGQLLLTGRQGGTGGQVRVVSVDAGSTATKLGLTAPTTNSGAGNVANIAAVTPTEVRTVVQAAVANLTLEYLGDGTPRASANTGISSILVAAPNTAADIGFVTGANDTGATGTAGVIPAGTVVQAAGPVNFVTMQDVNVTAANAGPYAVKVRHALDDGTGAGVGPGALTVTTPIAIDAFGATALAPLTAALTEAAIDAQYSAAIDSTKDINTVGREINIIYSARQSNVVRRALRQNAIDASANGCLGRRACIRPPLGTTRTAAMGAGEPGNQAYRDQRVIYCFPGFSTFVPAIALAGTAGGTGFNSTGIVDVGADGFMATLLSQLPPEENPAQETDLLGGVVGLESSPNAQGFQLADYINFKAAGIAAPRIDAGVAGFQSGVTNVDPAVFPSLKNIARRGMADYIEDSLAIAMKAFGKKLTTAKRRQAAVAQIRAFLNNLLSPNNPDAQRIDGFTIDAKSGNTPTTLGQGLYRIIINVRTLSSLDSIVLQSTIGETVDVTELPVAA